MAMTLNELRDHINAVVDYNLADELEDVSIQMRENGWSAKEALERHVASHLLALCEFIDDPVSRLCPSCEGRISFIDSLPGQACPHCGHVEVEETED